jgi:hypothetical protein
MSTDKRITVRLGELSQKLERHCKKSRTTPALLIRKLIAKHLGVPEPELKVGNPNFGKKKSAQKAVRRDATDPR